MITGFDNNNSQTEKAKIKMETNHIEEFYQSVRLQNWKYNGEW